MKVTYPYTPGVFLTDIEFETYRTRLETSPNGFRTFIVGTMTAFLDPRLRRLPDPYITFIESIHQFYKRAGIDSDSCFYKRKIRNCGHNF